MKKHLLALLFITAVMITLPSCGHSNSSVSDNPELDSIIAAPEDSTATSDSLFV